MFQRVNYGPVTNEKNASLQDLQPREWLVIVPIVAVAILMGVFPNLFLKPIEPSVNKMIGQVSQRSSRRLQAGNSDSGSRNSASIPRSTFHIPR
jgi:NADH-quinone oxidoreductase subunit M